jgi:hypothetical protein
VADIHLDLGLWPTNQRIQQRDNEFLTRPFTLEELDVTIKEMKNNTAPGPDGFSVEFFKSFFTLDQRRYQGNTRLFTCWPLRVMAPKLWCYHFATQGQTSGHYQTI